jgi:hypothetical protein
MTTYPEKMLEATARFICECEGGFPPDRLVPGFTSARLRPNWMNYTYAAEQLLDRQCAALGITPAALAALEGDEAVVMPREMDPAMVDCFHDTIRIYCRPKERDAEILNHDEVYANLVALSPHAKSKI